MFDCFCFFEEHKFAVFQFCRFNLHPPLPSPPRRRLQRFSITVSAPSFPGSQEADSSVSVALVSNCIRTGSAASASHTSVSRSGLKITTCSPSCLWNSSARAPSFKYASVTDYHRKLLCLFRRNAHCQIIWIWDCDRRGLTPLTPSSHLILSLSPK